MSYPCTRTRLPYTPSTPGLYREKLRRSVIISRPRDPPPRSQRPIHPRAARDWKRLQVSAAADAVPYQTYQRPAIYYGARGHIRLYSDITIIVLCVIPTVRVCLYTYTWNVRDWCSRNVIFFLIFFVRPSSPRPLVARALSNETICTRVLYLYAIDAYGFFFFFYIIFISSPESWVIILRVHRKFWGSGVQRKYETSMDFVIVGRVVGKNRNLLGIVFDSWAPRPDMRAVE
jgi:hypothetical protein